MPRLEYAYSPGFFSSMVLVASISSATETSYGFALPTAASTGPEPVGAIGGRPELWVASSNRVTSPAGDPASSVRYFDSGSSTAISPRCTASASSMPVKVLVIEPSSYGVCGVGGSPPSAEPRPAKATWPPRTRPTDRVS